MLVPKTEDAEKLKLVSGYRPITPCNVDYRIFAKVLTSRIQGVIPLLVGEHQTCGIRGRTIRTHIARSVLDCYVGNDAKAAMLQIDLEKALIVCAIMFFSTC